VRIVKTFSRPVVLNEMSKMQIEGTSNKGGKNYTKGTKATILLSLVSMLLLSALVVLPSQNQAEALKIIVYLKYSDWQKHHPKEIGKVVLNGYSDIDEIVKKLKLSKLPKSVTVNMDVDVGEQFSIHLNSYATDDGTQVEGINHPAKVPEKVKIQVP
jgi:hypothetical protein